LTAVGATVAIQEFLHYFLFSHLDHRYRRWFWRNVVVGGVF
jgi:hypothetical protein